MSIMICHLLSRTNLIRETMSSTEIIKKNLAVYDVTIASLDEAYVTEIKISVEVLILHLSKGSAL